MCGICGLANSKHDTVSAAVLEPMIQALAHRGPDDRGIFSEPGITFGHTRLSILDLTAAGHQPMESDDRQFVIVLNGEIYNFKELAHQLDLSGLRSHSDTEVLLGAFEKLGTECIPLLNGIFAFAIYDKQQQRLWLVRDRLGVKPLFYRLDKGALQFASEIRALLANESSLRCNLAAVHEWLYYGTTLGEATLYQQVHNLLPGHYLELDLNTFSATSVCYWSPAQYAEPNGHHRIVADPEEQTRKLLDQAVRRQLVADVPVGVFLSGGVDSTAITAFAVRHYSGKLATYSAGFDFDRGINELPKARAIAALYGTDHHEIHVSGAEIGDIVVKMVLHHGMPFSDAANIPLYLLGTQVNQITKVVLQGDGGDELFGGYRRYSTLSFYRTARMLAALGKIANQMSPRGSQYYRRQRYFNALTSRSLPETMALLLTEEDAQQEPESVFSEQMARRIREQDPFARFRACQSFFSEKDIVNQMLLVDSMIILPDIFLPKVDRATMAAGVEARVPFLDNDLVDFCMRLSGPQKVRFGQKKWLLKRALKGIVPDSVLNSGKTGFGVPYGYWLRTKLKALFHDQRETFQRSYPGVLDSSRLGEIYRQHESQTRDRSFLLWKMLNFFIWANHFKISFEAE
jgi:asparagine synthase (glutamine-hydrolysing)